MKGRMLLLLMALPSALMLAACDSGGTVALTTPKSSPVPVATVPDPAIKEAVSAAPSYDVGHTVHITKDGIRPRSLASLCCAPVVFVNETAQPLAVQFFTYKIASGPIAPGSRWQWVPPNPESVGYHLVSDPTATGQIQVESPDW